MLKLIKNTTFDTLRAVGPLVVLAIVLQLTLVRAPGTVFARFLVGSILAIAGMVFFLLGIEVGILPAGKVVGSSLAERRSVWLIISIAFLVGFSTTIAEPDVLVLAKEAEVLSGGGVRSNLLMYIIGIGVAFFVAMAMIRILLRVPFVFLLTASYLIVIVLSFFTPPDFFSLAFDAGSVTTGVLTAPVVLALGIGVSSVLAGRSAIRDGFGLLGLASIGPIIAVMIMGILS